MAFGFAKLGARWAEARKNRPDTWPIILDQFRSRGAFFFIAVAAAFTLASASILMLRNQAVAIHPGQYVSQDITSRVGFIFLDRDALTNIVDPVHYVPNQTLVRADTILSDTQWALLKAEQKAYWQSLGAAKELKADLGTAGMVLLLSIVLWGYIAYYQPRIVAKRARAVAIAALLVALLLLAQLAAIGTAPLYYFGLVPTILAAMILAISYDRRFAMGVAGMHAILVATALNQGLGFFLILWVGVLTCGFLVDDIRTRSKLVEVGAAAGLAMMAATAAAGATSMDPILFIGKNCLYAGAAGLSAGFIVLGILPFIEHAFRITTGMTLLEIADASQPLLRRLAMEAPGTYQHSLQVATLAEAAAEAISANSLLARIGSYYHDIGKIDKAEYFIENQNGKNPHVNLSPNVSLLIIIGHVKDGLAMAREYKLPAIIWPFIEQHHGTMVVEYFYRRACAQKDPRGLDPSAVSDDQYRYPGPKPKRKEIAVVMLADAVESAARSMPDPTAARIEDLVRDLTLKRLLDGQFDECDLTMAELEKIQLALMKTLCGMYHGRIPYPALSTTAPAKRSA